MISISAQDILFDDRSFLEAALGKDALKASTFHADCDCDGYYPSQDDEDLNPHQIAPSAAAAY